ncbi:two-component system chemotaxis response regulator CheY [Pseudoduganella flava]|uniref:Response regulator n=1 Tax=Pseudoduganella flava TaxID=871742 RepID=A0A562P7I4_9BURK|nr:response regulator [Pseudoduganella flava]QGZ40006.1 response regulator [Pseudoduganella flava]TWI39946.1 two-component system chemotaxis response regulator CheY [Pseudoduganella flava]
MLKAVIIDGSAVARGLLNTVLTDGGYDVVGQAHTCAAGSALLIKFNPQIICIARDQVEQDIPGMTAMRKQWPKALIFMMSSEFDANTIQTAHAMGINGFIVKPFNADTVLKTIRNTVITMVKRQQKAQAAQNGDEAPPAEPGEG